MVQLWLKRAIEKVKSKKQLDASGRPYRETSVERFTKGPSHGEMDFPGIGGCVRLQAPHSEHLLPAEVVLFEPSAEDMFALGAMSPTCSSKHVRFIFLNTHLTHEEVDALARLRQEWRRQHKTGGRADENDELPEFIRLNALRILQYKRFDAAKSVDLIELCLQERVQRLPLTEADTLPDLSSGAMYWHGRDHKCRPCLVVRISRMADLIKDKERCVKLVIFVLEYAIRFAMVPGRVENWVVLVDLEHASKIVSLYELPAMCLTAKAIATTLESVYCCRMVWIKLLNMPHFMGKVVQSVIPAEKKKKVSVVEDHRELLQSFEPNQLEARYGGTAPDLEPHEVYPFKFFPNARGPTRGPAASDGNLRSMTTSSTTASSLVRPASPRSEPPTSLHRFTSRSFHEGQIWDPSAPEAWMQQAKASSLTPEAAEALSALSGSPASESCQDLDRWMELMGATFQPGRCLHKAASMPAFNAFNVMPETLLPGAAPAEAEAASMPAFNPTLLAASMEGRPACPSKAFNPTLLTSLPASASTSKASLPSVHRGLPVSKVASAREARLVDEVQTTRGMRGGCLPLFCQRTQRLLSLACAAEEKSPFEADVIEVSSAEKKSPYIISL
mmetsp:Transcript_43041/g.77829  ORF Transcript_43041/g.77829 Transcript_43041/m.77829 type:complete len:616 (+) Transcript_43041:209-2056(+)